MQYNTHTISLNNDEEAQLSHLETKGVTIIEIFRMGLLLMNNAESSPLTPPKELIERVTKLIKG